MIKKTNGSIYNFKMYIQIQKLNCVIHFSNDELSSLGRKNQNTSYDRNKMGH